MTTLATYVHLLAKDLPDPNALDVLTAQGGNTVEAEPTENGRNTVPFIGTETPEVPAGV